MKNNDKLDKFDDKFDDKPDDVEIALKELSSINSEKKLLDNYLKQISEDMKMRLNQDTDALLKKCLKEVEDLLKAENELFERFARELLTKDELEYDKIEAIFAEYGKTNPRRFSGGLSTGPSDGGWEGK